MKTSFGEKSSGTSLQIHKTVRFPLRRLVCSYIAGSDPQDQILFSMLSGSCANWMACSLSILPSKYN